jgi:hypothetical protein
MKIVEKNSATTRSLRLPRAQTAPVEDEREVLIRQLRRVTERNLVAFDQGFKAAADMVARGADLEQLVAATGVVSREWEDTEPTEMTFDDVTSVDQVTFVDDTGSLSL